MLNIVSPEAAASHESIDSFLIAHPVLKRVAQVGARGDLQLRKYSIEVATDRSR
jgi:hypothetical protein